MTVEPIILNADVARNVVYYSGLVKQMCHYQETLDSLLRRPAIPEEIKPFLESAREDAILMMDLNISSDSPAKAPEYIGEHYQRLHDYFNTPLPPLGWRSGTIGVLDHLGFYVWDVKQQEAIVDWVTEQRYDALKKQLESELLPLFTKQSKRLMDEADRMLQEKGHCADERTLSMSLIPLLEIQHLHPHFSSGVAYLRKVHWSGEQYADFSRVYLSVGVQPQILFDDLKGDDFTVGIEPDKGYVIDTLSEKGLVGKPKMSLKAALGYLAKSEK